jgi:hypothetical protein
MIPFVDPIRKDASWLVLFALMGAGLVQNGPEHRAVLDSYGRYLLSFKGTDIGLLVCGLPYAEYVLPVAGLTTVGKQIIQLLPTTVDIEFFKLLASGVLEGTNAPLLVWGDPRIGDRDIKPVKRVALVKIFVPALGRFEIREEIWATSPQPLP